VHIDEEPYNVATAHACRVARSRGTRVVFFAWQNIRRRYPPPFAWFERYVFGRAAGIAGTVTAADWQVVLSSRPEVGQRAPCRERPDKRLHHQATGFAIRTGVAFRRNPDLSSLANSNPDIPWGTDITIHQGAGLRLLSVHLVSGCWGAEQDRDAERTAICETLRLQVGALKSWVEARQAENIPYAILGDFNRRLALDGDWAWRVLSSARLGLHLATAELPTNCDPRYTALIDHIVVSGGLVSRIVPDSLREIPRLGDHPDHCAIMLSVRLGT